MTKRKNQKLHARYRMLERYGINMTERVHDDIIKLIKAGKAVLLRSTSNRSKVYQVQYNDKSFTFVYDKDRKQIVTFLAPEMNY